MVIWGNSGVGIPVSVSEAAHVRLDQPVIVREAPRYRLLPLAAS